MYNEKVIKEFQNPKNVGALRGANGVGRVGNAACGDIMKVYLKINDEGIIEDCSFKTFGCAAAIASTSVAMQLIKGMTIEEALKVRNSQIIEILGGLPPIKIHCSIMAEEAIKAAIDDYYKRLKKGKNKSADSDDEDVEEEE